MSSYVFIRWVTQRNFVQGEVRTMDDGAMGKKYDIILRRKRSKMVKIKPRISRNQVDKARLGEIGVT